MKIKSIDVALLSLRNRLPQNVTDETTAREVAKDIIHNDMPVFFEYSDCVQSGIKYLLIAELLEQSTLEPATDRTLGELFVRTRENDMSKQNEKSATYRKMLAMLPEEDYKLARFHICDKLMRYQAFC